MKTPVDDVFAVYTIAESARQVRDNTLRLLEATDRAALTWAPTGTSNHILWHAGHVLWVQDVLTIEPLTGRGELPREFAAKFAQYSHPAQVAEWPDPAEVAALLKSQLARILELLIANTQQIVANVNKPPSQGGWPLLPGIVHGWHDEAKHQGEMHLLHKLFRVRGK